MGECQPLVICVYAKCLKNSVGGVIDISGPFRKKTPRSKKFCLVLVQCICIQCKDFGQVQFLIIENLQGHVKFNKDASAMDVSKHLNLDLLGCCFYLHIIKKNQLTVISIDLEQLQRNLGSLALNLRYINTNQIRFFTCFLT